MNDYDDYVSSFADVPLDFDVAWDEAHRPSPTRLPVGVAVVALAAVALLAAAGAAQLAQWDAPAEDSTRPVVAPQTPILVPAPAPVVPVPKVPDVPKARPVKAPPQPAAVPPPSVVVPSLAELTTDLALSALELTVDGSVVFEREAMSPGELRVPLAVGPGEHELQLRFQSEHRRFSYETKSTYVFDASEVPVRIRVREQRRGRPEVRYD